MNTAIEIFAPGYLTPANYRESVTTLEEYLLSLPQVEMQVKQHFLPGVYTRELLIPKGVVLTGCVHKEECVTIISKGEILIATQDGGQRLIAGDSFVTPKGIKRVGLAVEDTLCVTVHKYNGLPLDEDTMKQVIGCDTYAIYDEYLAVLELEKDYQDYQLLKKELGMSEEDIQKFVNLDNVDMNFDCGVYLGESKLHGTGVFAKEAFLEYEDISPAMVGDKRTVLGRFTNHSVNPNSSPKGDMLIATRYIQQDEEITVNYRNMLAERSQLCQVA